jgi:pSer/pThr/pTyr-binding forkhead associated (FHA) protein
MNYFDRSELPNSNFISRNHAEIRFDGKDYLIQDWVVLMELIF